MGRQALRLWALTLFSETLYRIETGFYVFGPDGSAQEDGGGADFMVDTVQGILTSTFQ